MFHCINMFTQKQGAEANIIFTIILIKSAVDSLNLFIDTNT